MKQQVFVINGGNVFDTYEDYLAELKRKEVTLERLLFKDWKTSLSENLGEDFTVVFPQMPNKQNARYLEWKISFEKLIPFMTPGVILIGHSLGGIFLVKYLSEEVCPISIRATFLVAAPFSTPTNHPLVDFTLTHSLERFSGQAGRVFLYQSEDDAIVPYPNVLDFQNALPNAVLRPFVDRGHMNTESFPELVQDVRETASQD